MLDELLPHSNPSVVASMSSYMVPLYVVASMSSLPLRHHYRVPLTHIGDYGGLCSHTVYTLEIKIMRCQLTYCGAVGVCPGARAEQNYYLHDPSANIRDLAVL